MRFYVAWPLLVEGSTDKMRNIYPLNTHRVLVTLMLLAALAVGSLFLFPGGFAQAQAAGPIEYAENGTDPVATYTGLDPEGRPIYWSLVATGGTLPTDITDIIEADVADADEFTISSDGALSFKLPPDFDTPNDAGENNEYKIVVVASDDAMGVTGRHMTYHKVTVTVTDVDEDGSISLSAQQPQVSVDLTATLTDQDDTDADTANELPNTKWKWEQGTSANGPWIVIVDATTNVETPVAGIVGKYLRATATYTDKHGDDKSAMAVSAHAVRAVPSGVNSPPAFTPTTVDRNVDENSPPGTNVGKPVTAADTPGDILTYTLADDESNYKIDPATGQITVAPRTILDREPITAGTHSVVVTATDPAGLPTDPAATVTIAIKNVNEAPTVTGGATRVSYAENTVTAVQEVVAMMTYAASDVEGDTPILSLSGADMGDFDIATDGMLTFKTSPNFESPADSNGDNVYMVTVVATDSGTPKLTATRGVVITVTNEDDAGEVALSSVQPKVGFDFTATLTDEDGGVKDVKWQWASANRAAVNDCPDAAAPNGTWTNIAKAKSNTYRPVAADATDPFQCLQATATYTDSQGSVKSAMEVSVNEVVVDEDNRVPVFRAGGEATGKVITSDTRSIDESSASNTNVGTAVVATDPNGTVDILTYTLGGSDESSFDIGSTNGQIMVGTETKLNYEGKKVYSVTVTAVDPSQASATISITINVADVDEAPVIAGDDIVKEFRENSTSTVETFRATDPEGRPVYWSLKTGDGEYPDDGDFSINSNGVLSFASPPDFEESADSNEDNSYKVIVLASDDVPDVETDNLSLERKVTVTVTDVVEQGSISVSRRYPQVSVEVVATLTDDDASDEQISAATWQWYKGSAELQGFGADTASYTPQNTGAIRVKASYVTKGSNREEELSINVQADTTGDNESPAFPNDNAAQARIVDENRPVGTNVGAPIVAMDPDSGDRSKLTYTLSDNTNFSITTSGQLKTKASLDHEANPTFSVTVTATDPSGTTGVVTVTVTVDDVNEAPVINGGPTRAPDWLETKAITDAVATYTAADVDDDTLTWSLTGTDASDFNISNEEDNTPGELTFKEMPDYEKPAASNNVYRVTVNVSDGKLSATRPMTVTVTDAPEGGMVTISSVQPKIAVELTASLEDSDGGVKDVTWQWAKSATDSGTFTPIDGATSATYTPVAGDIDMFLRATASYTDSQGEQTAEAGPANDVILNTDNRAPMFPDTGERMVAENTAAGMPIGDGTADNSSIPNGQGEGDEDDEEPVTATDPNDDNLTYTLGGPDMASFNIDRPSGLLRTKAKLDYETRNTYMVTVTATDPNGLSDSIDVTIKVTDMDEAPKILVGGLAIRGLSTVSYAENGMGDVATYGAVGMDAASARWSLEGPDAGDFMISGDGVLTFRSAPDYEMPADADANNTYMVTVKADNDMYMATRAVTIRVTDVDDATLLISGLSNVDYDENGADAVATYMATGRPNAASAMWSLEGPDAGDFMISGGGVLTFENSPDYEMPADADTNNTYMVTVNADDGTYMATRAVTIRVTDVDETTLLISGLSNVDYAENGAGAVATYMATGPNAASAMWSLEGPDAGDFMISGGGVLTFENSPDYEMPADDNGDNTYMVTVKADDGTYMATRAVTIRVTDVDDTVVEQDLFDRYNTDGDQEISKSEVIEAINDYLFGEENEAITKEQVITIINLYLFG